MNTLFPLDQVKRHVILSASRMTDMPKYYPVDLIQEVEKRIDKGVYIHTLVLWTKHPIALFNQPLHDFLLALRNKGVQLYVQLTITGLGGIPFGIGIGSRPLFLEPNAPKLRESLLMLPKVIDLVGKPDRVRVRIDPIVRIIDSNNEMHSSLRFFETIVDTASKSGITTFSFSFLERDVHQKVDKRFKELDIMIYPPNENERSSAFKWMKEIENRYSVKVFSCSVPGLPISKCIDGEFLQEIHDNQIHADLQQPFKRALCGCTESIDIGGWPPKKCYTGCQYCYSKSSY
jgi:hypothetical protein